MFDEKKYIATMIKDQVINRSFDWRDGDRPSTYEAAIDLFWNSCIEDGHFNFGNVKIPNIKWFYGWRNWPIVYTDSIMIHHLLNDEYTVENAHSIERCGGEGPYFMDEVIAKRGDVLIDAGAYVGDFTAVASERGAKVYAFEPSTNIIPILQDTAMLNDNITVVEEGLGDKVINSKIALRFPGGDVIDEGGILHMPDAKITSEVPCKINTIDNFSKENDLHIDFIKADIEGFERFMLKGAENVLKTQEPKLAIRLYHNYYEDRKVLPKIIMDINPRYKLTYGLNGLTVYATTERGV